MTEQITTNNDAPGDVSVQLSYPHSNIDGRYAQLTVIDRVSGVQIVRATLGPDELMQFMAHSSVHLSGAVLPQRPELIGRRQQITGTNLGRDSVVTPDEVRDEYLAAGWESVQIQRTNFGHRVVARRWITDGEHATTPAAPLADDPAAVEVVENWLANPARPSGPAYASARDLLSRIDAARAAEGK